MRTKLSVSTVSMAVALLVGCGGQHWQEAPAKKVVYKELELPEHKTDFTVTTGASPKLFYLEYAYETPEKTQEKAAFFVYVAPNSEVTFNSATSYLILNYGWIYLIGQNPRAATGRVTAGARGSEFGLVRAKNAAGQEIARVFYLGGSYAWGKLKADPCEQHWTSGSFGESIEPDAFKVSGVPPTGDPYDQLKAMQDAALLVKILIPFWPWIGATP